MALFHHIVYPVDFSPRCLSVGPFVAAMARRMNAPITLLHSIPMPRGWFGGIEGAYPPFFDVTTMQKDIETRLSQFKAEAQFDGLDINCVVNMGDPAFAITDFASKIEDCLIMIPTHGFGKFRNLLVGSVTAKVLHDSRSAVWTDAHVEDPGTDQPLDPRRILCAVALDGHDEPLIRKALELAGESAAEVRLVHAVPVEQMRPQKYFSLEFDRFLMDLAKEHIAELQHKLGVDLQACVRGGAVSTVVRQSAMLHGSDLIVAGRGLIRSPLGRLRTNAYAIIRDAPCPVLSF
jgi:nucleotide-binding universal stress UspA family protein